MTCLENQPWTPLAAELSHYDPQWLALHNRLHRLRQSWTGQCAGLAMTVQWSGAVPRAQAGIDVALTLGDAPLKLSLPVEALGLLGLTPMDINGLPGAMLLELALLSMIEPLEQLAGLPLRIVDNAAAPDAQPLVVSLTMQVQLAQGAPLSVGLQLSPAAATLLADLLEQHATPAAHPLPALNLPFSVESGEAQLSVAELRSLNPGDVVMLDHWPDRHARLVLQGRRLHARAELDGNTLTLLEQPIALNFLKEHPMTGSAESAAPPSQDSPLDDLPLKLVCQVGSVELSLAQLRELGTGSLVQLTPQLHDGVDLMVNGRRVGQGQLVKIGDGLGVRLLSFATP
jgi:type III secretion protein Q